MMREAILTFHSTHGAIAGEAALLDAGIEVRVMPVPGEISAGCGLCLRVAQAEYAAARDVCIAVGVQIQGVYTRAESGYAPWRPCQ